MVTSSLDRFQRSTVLSKVLKQVKQEGFRVFAKDSRGCDQVPRAVGLLQLEPHRGQSLGPRSNPFGGTRIQSKGKGHQAALALPEGLIVAKALVTNPLMQGMLVDQQQFLSGFNEHVGACKLPEWLHFGHVVQHPVQGRFDREVAGSSRVAMKVSLRA